MSRSASERRVQHITLGRKATEAVRRGHPWVFRDPSVPGLPAGTVVSFQGGWGLCDEGPIAVRVLGRDKPVPIPRLLAERVRAADTVRQRLVGGDTTAWRLLNGAGDGLPGLVADRYGDVVVFKVYAKAWLPWLEHVVQALQLPWCSGILRRLGVQRVDGGEGARVVWGTVPEAVVVREHGMKLLVRPHVGQKTGLFLDQREHRRMVRQWASGHVVANLFAYNGGFSVAAALGGAARVLTVDIAPHAIDDARETFVLNGLHPDEHVFACADVFSWRPPRHERVDFVVLDPPALTRGKRSDDAAVAAYKKLHRLVGGRDGYLPRGGLLATSSCTARMDVAGWKEAVRAGLYGDWSWHWTSTEPPDHPTALVHHEARYLKFALLRRR